MKLYYAPAACSLSPHIVLRELGLPFELEKVDLKAHTTETGKDYYAINPKGYVPALRLDDGSVLTEGPAIVQYLADKNPATQLVAANGTIERYRQQEWLNFITSELHKPLGSLFNPATTPEQRKQVEERLVSRFEVTAKALDGKSFLFGEQFTVADAYLYTILNWTGFLKVSLAPWPALLQFLKRVAARPAVQQALETEGVIKK